MGPLTFGPSLYLNDLFRLTARGIQNHIGSAGIKWCFRDTLIGAGEIERNLNMQFILLIFQDVWVRQRPQNAGQLGQTDL